METWQILLLVFYVVVTIGLLNQALGLDKEGPDPSLPPPTGADAPQTEFAVFLAIILWPVVLALGIVIGIVVIALGIVIGIPVAIIHQFLYTPGYTCFGMSCAKGPKVRSAEHTAEAGLAAPAVVTVPPPAAPVEDMGMKPMAKSSDVPEEAPPAYQEDRLNQA